MPVRVLHVVNDLSAGGAERVVLELCRRAGPDFASSVVTVAGGGPLAGAFAEAGIPVTHGERPTKSFGVRSLGHIALRARAADVVHTHLFAGDTWGRLASILSRHGAVVTTEHNIDRDESWQPLVRRALSWRSRIVVAVSEAVARSCPGRDIRVIPNGVDLRRFEREWRGGAGVLAVGRVVPQKGFDVLCAVAERLPGIPFRIAGAGVPLPGPPNVEWLGLRSDIPELLAESDVLAVPSRWEGFGVAALEGLAAGVPVVASAVDGLAEVVGTAGILVPAEDSVALSDVISRLANDIDLRARYSSLGRKRAANFSMDRMVEQYRAVWREAAGKR